MMHYTSLSRSALAKNFKKAVEKIKKESPGIKNMITFKSYKEKFEKEGFNVVCNYGKCQGLNTYEGQDLIVAGTPNMDERVYLLLAATILKDVALFKNQDYMNVQRNGFEFYFNSYEKHDNSVESNLLREIQFMYIENDLIQAVGRSRLLNHDCTVHLYSNFPLIGAIIVD